MSTEIIMLKQIIEKEGGSRTNTLKIKVVNAEFQIWINMGENWAKIKLDHSQAHLLMLYLQEHLSSAPKA